MLPFAPLSAIVTIVPLSGHCNVPITVIKVKCWTITKFVLYGKKLLCANSQSVSEDSGQTNTLCVKGVPCSFPMVKYTILS